MNDVVNNNAQWFLSKPCFFGASSHKRLTGTRVMSLSSANQHLTGEEVHH